MASDPHPSGDLTARAGRLEDADALASLMFMARRLYERNGYCVTGERTNARYERITGSAGRILMVKSVAPR